MPSPSATAAALTSVSLDAVAPAVLDELHLIVFAVVAVGFLLAALLTALLVRQSAERAR